MEVLQQRASNLNIERLLLIKENHIFQGFPDGSDGKESACNVGDQGLIPGLGRSPGGGHGHPLQYSYLKNPHGQRSLVGLQSMGSQSQTRLSD